MVSEFRLEALLSSYSRFVPFFAKRAKRPRGRGEAKRISTRRPKKCRQIDSWVKPLQKSALGIFFIFCLHPNSHFGNLCACLKIISICHLYRLRRRQPKTHDIKCHSCSDTKCHTIASVTESVILMKFGELSYFDNFFDFGNVFGDIHRGAPYTPEKNKI